MFGVNIFKLNHKKPKEIPPADDWFYVLIRLNARMMPIDRAEHFEEPLAKAFKKFGVGEIIGGGTQQAPDPIGIEFCDIEVAFYEPKEDTLDQLIRNLEKLGAPKGSKLLFEDDTPERIFGKLEGMAIYLNGTDLPEEVYENTDVNDVANDLNSKLGFSGEYLGYWNGSDETSLYFYGRSYEKMKAAVTAYINKEPLCARARLEQIA